MAFRPKDIAKSGPRRPGSPVRPVQPVEGSDLDVAGKRTLKRRKKSPTPAEHAAKVAKQRRDPSRTTGTYLLIVGGRVDGPMAKSLAMKAYQAARSQYYRVVKSASVSDKTLVELLRDGNAVARALTRDVNAVVDRDFSFVGWEKSTHTISRIEALFIALVADPYDIPLYTKLSDALAAASRTGDTSDDSDWDEQSRAKFAEKHKKEFARLRGYVRKAAERILLSPDAVPYVPPANDPTAPRPWIFDQGSYFDALWLFGAPTSTQAEKIRTPTPSKSRRPVDPDAVEVRASDSIFDYVVRPLPYEHTARSTVNVWFSEDAWDYGGIADTGKSAVRIIARDTQLDEKSVAAVLEQMVHEGLLEELSPGHYSRTAKRIPTVRVDTRRRTSVQELVETWLAVDHSYVVYGARFDADSDIVAKVEAMADLRAAGMLNAEAAWDISLRVLRVGGSAWVFRASSVDGAPALTAVWPKHRGPRPIGVVADDLLRELEQAVLLEVRARGEGLSAEEREDLLDEVWDEIADEIEVEPPDDLGAEPDEVGLDEDEPTPVQSMRSRLVRGGAKASRSGSTYRAGFNAAVRRVFDALREAEYAADGPRVRARIERYLSVDPEFVSLVASSVRNALANPEVPSDDVSAAVDAQLSRYIPLEEDGDAEFDDRYFGEDDADVDEYDLEGLVEEFDLKEQQYSEDGDFDDFDDFDDVGADDDVGVDAPPSVGMPPRTGAAAGQSRLPIEPKSSTFEWRTPPSGAPTVAPELRDRIADLTTRGRAAAQETAASAASLPPRKTRENATCVAGARCLVEVAAGELAAGQIARTGSATAGLRDAYRLAATRLRQNGAIDAAGALTARGARALHAQLRQNGADRAHRRALAVAALEQQLRHSVKGERDNPRGIPLSGRTTVVYERDGVEYKKSVALYRPKRRDKVTGRIQRPRMYFDPTESRLSAMQLRSMTEQVHGAMGAELVYDPRTGRYAHKDEGVTSYVSPDLGLREVIPLARVKKKLGPRGRASAQSRGPLPPAGGGTPVPPPPPVPPTPSRPAATPEMRAPRPSPALEAQQARARAAGAPDEALIARVAQSMLPGSRSASVEPVRRPRRMAGERDVLAGAMQPAKTPRRGGGTVGGGKGTSNDDEE